MKTYTTVITTDYVGKPIAEITLGQRTVKTPRGLQRLKNDVWTIINSLAMFNGWECDNGGTMFIAYPRDPEDNSCMFAKIYDDDFGEAINLD